MELRTSHFQCGKCEGRRSQSSEARTPSLALSLRWARKLALHLRCVTWLPFVCMLRYWIWYAVPIWLLYSSIWIWFVVPNCFLYGTTFIMEHFSWTVSIYYDTHHEMLCRTAYFLSPACVHSRGNTPPHYNSSANKRITNCPNFNVALLPLLYFSVTSLHSKKIRTKSSRISPTISQSARKHPFSKWWYKLR